ncbi:MAG: chemotaxis protein CheB [FCB group bacterium]|jgi:two-component system chemotaxis response regulator CheB
MAEPKKILIVEDEVTNSFLLKRLLSKAGYSVVLVRNGIDAMLQFEKEKFDVLLTDWMMPMMDGIELIRKVRELISPLPYIVMVTALVSDNARNYALESGADDYIAKPLETDELLSSIKDGLNKNKQEIPLELAEPIHTGSHDKPPFVAVVVAASTGGPPALITLLRDIKEIRGAAFFIVQHGPPWMLETFAKRLQSETRHNVLLAKNGIIPEAGKIYVAPGEKHLTLDAESFKMKLDENPKENFVRPSADPLFRSAAEAFGEYCIAVVLTGLGRDGILGCKQIVSADGTVYIQDPESAVAPSMPKSIIESDIKHMMHPLETLGKAVAEKISELSARLKE